MVICHVCKQAMKHITNTHLLRHHMTTEEYKTKFPDCTLVSAETSAKKSSSLMGKNLGNPRPDAKKRMLENNPMKDPVSNSKMGKTRASRIHSGEIDALRSLGHLPSSNEVKVLSIFKDLGFDLEYVGDGALWIGGRCPDFINEEKKIIVELDLDCFYHEEEKQSTRDHYLKYGYLAILAVSADEEYLKRWLNPFFQGGPKWEKITDLTKEKTSGKQKVYNYHISPNNNYFANRILVHNCYADAFRASLYTSFFDNSKSVGLRHCNPDFYRRELDKLFQLRGTDLTRLQGTKKAVAMEIPIRFGIRFEDFHAVEGKKGVSLQMLRYLAENSYPVMINTKSGLIGREDYVRALSENPARAAVHITMISNRDDILKRIEPGAPNFATRLEAGKNLVSAGVRVVARIEPFLVFNTDHPEDVEAYCEQVWDAGIRHITFDTYSYSASNPGIRNNFQRLGIDYDRMFTVGCDSQGVGSILLEAFMQIFRRKGFSCSSFDLGCIPGNDQSICCEVGDWFQGGYNWGCVVGAIRYIKDHKGEPCNWKGFSNWVNDKGGFLSPALTKSVHELWNCQGNDAYSIAWGQGMEPVGYDEDGMIWRYNSKDDFRKELM